MERGDDKRPEAVMKIPKLLTPGVAVLLFTLAQPAVIAIGDPPPKKTGTPGIAS